MIPLLAVILISGQSEMIPKVDPLKACPPGYKDAGPSFCEKMEQRIPEAIPCSGRTPAPPGWYRQGDYCRRVGS
jgi:hypothetical protein